MVSPAPMNSMNNSTEINQPRSYAPRRLDHAHREVRPSAPLGTGCEMVVGQRFRVYEASPSTNSGQAWHQMCPAKNWNAHWSGNQTRSDSMPTHKLGSPLTCPHGLDSYECESWLAKLARNFLGGIIPSALCGRSSL
ncbi:MAG: hypothetical protein RL173_3789 [Fibrobacterota bacterium]